MANYDSMLNAFILAGDELNFAVPATLPNSNIPTPANTRIVGNGLANELTGDATNNKLEGGEGADRLIGGKGHDSYYVDDAGDVIEENADEGTDTVRSSVTYALAANVEDLVLTGTSNINGPATRSATTYSGTTATTSSTEAQATTASPATGEPTSSSAAQGRTRFPSQAPPRASASI